MGSANESITSLLWILWTVLLSGGLIADNCGSQAGSVFGRLGSSVVLTVAAWNWYGTSHSKVTAKYTLLIAIGMTLGTIGDFFMGGLLQALIPLPSPVLGGMTAFGLGHIIYIIACFTARRAAQLTSTVAMRRSILAWQVTSAIGWYFVVYLSPKESTQLLIWPALPYSQLLAGTAGVALGLAVQNKRFTVLAVGAALFLISDLVLAWGMFRDTFPHRTEAVWIPYGGGQMMIVFAIAAARRTFHNN